MSTKEVNNKRLFLAACVSLIVTAMTSGVSAENADLVAGQATLGNMVWFPVILVVLFGILFFMRNKVEEGSVPQEAH